MYGKNFDFLNRNALSELDWDAKILFYIFKFFIAGYAGCGLVYLQICLVQSDLPIYFLICI